MRACGKSVGTMIALAMLGGGAVGQGELPAEVVTDHGMRIWSFADDGGNRFSIAVLVGVGSRDESERPSGIAHFLEHVLFARTASRPKAAADVELRARGAEWNGYTSHEHTVYYLTLAAEHWQLAVDWLGDHVVHPAFAPEDVDAERRIVRQEIETRDGHAGQLRYESLLYPGHALGRSIGGDPGDLSSIDGAALRRFHAAHYRAGNVAVGFAGRVPHDECREAIRAAFAGLPAGEGSESTDVVEPRHGEMVPGRQSDAVRSAWMLAGYHMPAASARDLAIGGILREVFQQRLFEELRERRQITYSPSVDVVRHRDTQRLECHVEVANRGDLGTALEVVSSIAGELQALDRAALAAARLPVAKALTASSLDRLTEAMELCWLLRRREQAPRHFLAAVAAVEPADLVEFSRAHLRTSDRFVIASLPVGGSFTVWTALALLLVALLTIDGLGSFARTRRLVGWFRRLRRPRPAKRQANAPPIPVSGDELAARIQRFLEEEDEGGRR